MMPEDTIDVRMPDGTLVRGVPKNITKEDLLERYSRLPSSPGQQNAAESATSSIRAVSPTEHYVKMVGEALPSAGGVLGGFAGRALGGPLGAPGGSAIGGGLGKAIQLGAYKAAGVPNMPTFGEAMGQIGTEMGDQAVMEAGGQMLGGVPGALKKSAIRSMSKAVAPEATRVVRQGIEDKVAPGLLEPGHRLVAATREGLEKQVGERAASATQAVKGELATIPVGTPSNAGDILSRLENYKQSFMVPQQSGVPGASSDKGRMVQRVIGRMQSDISSMGPNAPFESAQKVLRQIDDMVYAKGMQTPVSTVKRSIEKDGVDMIRNELYKPYPDLQKLQAESSFWQNVRDAMESATPAESKASLRKVAEHGARMTLGGAAGYASHGAGGAVAGVAAIEALNKLVTSTAWRTTSAQTKDALARALYRADMPTVTRLVTRGIQANSRMNAVPPLPDQTEATQ